MKTKFKTLTFLMVMTLLSSCGDDDDDGKVSKPVISNLEVGISNSRIGYIGEDLHIDAEIEAEGLIDLITVEIHKEDGTGDEIEVEYDDFQGKKNADLHKHIDIPATAKAGDYHFHLVVTDQEGNSTTVEEDITIEELADEEAPELAVLSAPTNGQSFAPGETITVSGKVTDNETLEGMLVALVYETDEIADADVTGANTQVIVMLHTHDFESAIEHNFSASIDVEAPKDNNMTPEPIEGDNAWKSGNYYILVRVQDAKGNLTFSNHYPIEINL